LRRCEFCPHAAAGNYRRADNRSPFRASRVSPSLAILTVAHVVALTEVLITGLSGTRDALVVCPQPLLVFERHLAMITLAQIADPIVADLGLLQRATSQAQAAKRISELFLGGVGLRRIASRRFLELLPAFDKPPQVVCAPAQCVQEPLVDLVAAHLLGEGF